MKTSNVRKEKELNSKEKRLTKCMDWKKIKITGSERPC